MKILFINACREEGSRTKILADRVLSRMSGEITEVALNKEKITPVFDDVLSMRDRLIEQGRLDDEMFGYARQFADADEIVIAAPFWDLSFPSALKAYFEVINVVGITFSYSTDGTPVGHCRAKRLIYVSSAGGYTGEDAFGFGYIRALCEALYGIKQTVRFFAEGLDVDGADVDEILKREIKKIDNYFDSEVI